MIKYKLNCKDCNLSFDSWFANSKEYEKLIKKKLLNCHNCNSLNVKKSLMAPKLIKKNFSDKAEKKVKNFKSIKKMLNEYQKFIKNNLEYVGNDFAYEARSIHYNEKKKEKRYLWYTNKKRLKRIERRGN